MITNNNFEPKGKFSVKIKDNTGNIKYDFICNNDVTTPAKNSIFDVYFRGATQITSWYVGIINSASFTALSNNDTMSSHSGWTEFTNYSQINRQAWSPDAPTTAIISNSTAAEYNITATATLKGLFITSSNTVGGTTGTLWSTALFPFTVSVVNGDIVDITYTLTA